MTTSNPLLARNAWITRSRDGKAFGAAYSPIGGYIYRRRSLPQVEYARVSVSKVFDLHYWYEIEEALWEPVDVYGIPKA